MKDSSDEISITIRDMKKEDILDVSKIHAEAFPRQKHSLEWISSNFNAFPRIRYSLADPNIDLLFFASLRLLCYLCVDLCGAPMHSKYQLPKTFDMKRYPTHRLRLYKERYS